MILHVSLTSLSHSLVHVTRKLQGHLASMNVFDRHQLSIVWHRVQLVRIRITAANRSWVAVVRIAQNVLLSAGSACHQVLQASAGDPVRLLISAFVMIARAITVTAVMHADGHLTQQQQDCVQVIDSMPADFELHAERRNGVGLEERLGIGVGSLVYEAKMSISTGTSAQVCSQPHTCTVGSPHRSKRLRVVSVTPNPPVVPYLSLESKVLQPHMPFDNIKKSGHAPKQAYDAGARLRGVPCQTMHVLRCRSLWRSGRSRKARLRRGTWMDR